MDQNISHIEHATPVIRMLDDAAANRIAAGEVIERPASAVKELVENALDAGARRVDVDILDGGKTLLRVRDDGCGIPADQLGLAVARHATSKTDGHDLMQITSFGFRGEALASLGAAGRLRLSSRAAGADEAMMIRVEGGQIAPLTPVALKSGTVVELSDLFYATPARLKFLRTDRAETQAIMDVIKRLAMAEPDVSFTLRQMQGEGAARVLLDYPAQAGDFFDARLGRLRQVMGGEFAQNAMPIDAERDGMRLTGFASLPTYSRGNAQAQYLFVNGRPVRDRMLLSALRAAYGDVMSRDRFPVAALYLAVDLDRVDINVHPAKAEVRFRDAGIVRGLIIGAIKQALLGHGHQSATTIGAGLLGAAQAQGAVPQAAFYQASYARAGHGGAGARAAAYQAQAPQAAPGGFGFDLPQHHSKEAPEVQREAHPQAHPLGAAVAQIHETYIIAQTAEGFVLVDQHAAHERLVYERLKAGFYAREVLPAQALLLPEIVEMGQEASAFLLEEEIAQALAQLGLQIEPFGGGAICVRATPALLGEVNAARLLADIADELMSPENEATSETLRARMDAVLSRMSCHGSIRSGRRMRLEEMNALLREMEATPLSGQCNHGRPTYITLDLPAIERLFGRV